MAGGLWLLNDDSSLHLTVYHTVLDDALRHDVTYEHSQAVPLDGLLEGCHMVIPFGQIV